MYTHRYTTLVYLHSTLVSTDSSNVSSVICSFTEIIVQTSGDGDRHSIVDQQIVTFSLLPTKREAREAICATLDTVFYGTLTGNVNISEQIL